MSDAEPTIETVEDSLQPPFAITGDDVARVYYLLGQAIGIARRHRSERDQLRNEVEHLRGQHRVEVEQIQMDQIAINEGFRMMVDRFQALTSGGDLPEAQLDALREFIRPLQERLDEEEGT